jgi:hypothetical protein
MHDHSLTEAVLQYQKTGEGKKELVDAVAIEVYKIAHLKQDWDEDDAGDFFCYFLPKIPGLLDRYVHTGSSFEAYFYVHVVWSIKGFAKHLKTRRYEETLTTFKTFWEVHEHPPDSMLADEAPGSPEIPDALRTRYHISPAGNFTNEMWKQRFIFVILREAEYLDHSLVESIVAATGVNRRWLLNCIVTLKIRMEKRLKRLEMLRQKRNYWFYHYYLVQLRISDTYEPEKREELFRRLEFVRARYLRAKERVIRMHAHPTNQDISEVLSIPKGSVDSGIHHVLKNYSRYGGDAGAADANAKADEPKAA